MQARTLGQCLSVGQGDSADLAFLEAARVGAGEVGCLPLASGVPEVL